LNQQNTVPERKTNKRRTRRRQTQRRTRRRQPEKTKQKYEEAWITTYLNKRKTKMVLRGDFRPKMAKNHPL
jgi:hypothetical protein